MYSGEKHYAFVADKEIKEKRNVQEKRCVCVL